MNSKISLKPFSEREYLKHFRWQLSPEHKTGLLQSCAELHAPSRFAFENLWRPLRASSFYTTPRMDWPGTVFVLNNAFSGYELNPKAGDAIIITYLASLYLFGSHIKPSGLRLDSLVLRVVFTRFGNCAHNALVHDFAAFLKWMLEESVASDVGDTYFLKLGYVFLAKAYGTDASKCSQYISDMQSAIRSEGDPNKFTDSETCLTEWNTLISGLGGLNSEDLKMLFAFIPDINRGQ